MGLSVVAQPLDSSRLLETQQQLEAHLAAGLTDRVDEDYQKLSLLYRSANNLTDWLFTYWDWQAYHFEDAPRALRILEEALAKQWRQPQSAQEWEALLWVQANRGYHLFQEGQVLASAKAYEAAQQIWEKHPAEGFDALEYLYKPLGNNYTRLGDNERARAIFRKALAAAPQDEPENIAGLYNNIGLSYWNEGNQEEAVQALRQGLALPGLSPGKKGLLLTSLARSYYDQGKDAQAAARVAEALKQLATARRQTPDDPSIPDYLAKAYLVAGLVARRGGQTSLAAQQLTKSLALAKEVYPGGRHRDVGKIMLALAEVALDQQQPSLALDWINRALQAVIPTFSPRDPADSPDAKSFYPENTILEALALKAAALEKRYGQTQDVSLLEKALAIQEDAYQVEGQLRQTFQYNASKLLLQAMGQRRTEAAVAVAWECYQRTGDPAYIARAFSCMENNKALLLQEGVRENLFRQSLAETDQAMVRQLDYLREQIAALERDRALNGDLSPQGWKNLGSYQEQLFQLDNQLAQRYPNYRNVVHQRAVGLDSLQVALQDNALLAYFWGEKYVYLFVITAGNASLYRIGDTDSLAQHVREYQRFFQSRDRILNNPGAFYEVSHDVYLRLLTYAPSGAKYWLIVPDGYLSTLPFEALLTAPAKVTTALGRAPYLLRKQPLQYIYSAQLWLLTPPHHRTSRPGFLGVAPGFTAGQRSLAPLTHSKAELAAAWFRPQRILQGASATLTAFREQAPQYRIIHLSTHAEADSATVPRVEFLDQSLFLPEIYALRLQADLVVLSACQSALGRWAPGEGVMSLARGFTYAGAGSLLASQWKVSEQATAQILTDFYQQLGLGLTTVNALHQAKLNYLDDTQIPGREKSPYYWAALTLIGRDQAFPVNSRGVLESPWVIMLGLLVLGGGALIIWRRFLRQKP
ncbi:MAG: CHAT domain-containing protein [Lewinellaceae bacterium]|nr:CHAT domain-containing protein [Lewinellaceae bacterium]